MAVAAGDRIPAGLLAPQGYSRITPTGDGATASFTGASSGRYVLASQVVSDPGFEYYIEATAGLFLSSVNNSNGGISHHLALMVDTTVDTGPATAPAAGTIGARFVGQHNTSFASPELPRRRYPPVLTGEHTVHMILKLGSLGTATWGPLDSRSDYYFDVYVVPA